MKNHTIQPAIKGLKGAIEVPGDKSISHRALILGSLAEGESHITNLLLGEDVLATMQILQDLGVKMSHQPHQIKPQDTLTIYGKGLHSLKAAKKILYCGNSGTTMRLMLGLLAAQPFESVLTGDESLNKRPMERVTKPLSQMGAKFSVEESKGKKLIHVVGSSKLKGGEFVLPMASAQVKSALLLAGLYTKIAVKVIEPGFSRNHTEIMLKNMGTPLKPLNILVPNDFSSAAFFIVAGLIVPNSQITLKNIGLNPTRSVFIDVLKKMGGDLQIQNKKTRMGEEVGDLLVKSSSLKGYHLQGEVIAQVIDEIPIFAIAASCAKGISEVSEAEELRVKESDRIKTICLEVSKLGVSIQEKKDGFIIEGRTSFKSGTFESHGDHRIAMSLAIASLLSPQPSIINNVDCVATSFPPFFEILNQIRTRGVIISSSEI